MGKIEIDKLNEIVSSKSKKSPITNAFLISDIHIGLGKGSDDWIETHREYFEKFFFPLLKAKKDEGSVVLCLGDVFEDRKTTNLAANNLAIDMFEKMSEILPVYIIVGNHDMYNGSDNTITSLRSFDNIPNVNMIKKPTMWSIGDKEWKKNCLLIPFQGSVEKETTIVSQNLNHDYVFLHSDVKSLHYPNGMPITMGVDVSSSKGYIYAGHIHKREERDNMVYVGNPFQTTWGDFGNQKGIYKLNFKDGSREFFPNNVSPVFVQIPYEQIKELGDEDLEEIIRHNYVQVVIQKSESEKLKVNELYDRLMVFSPRKLIHPKEIGEANIIVDLGESAKEYKDQSIEEITTAMIEEMIVAENINKEELKTINQRYLKLMMDGCV